MSKINSAALQKQAEHMGQLYGETSSTIKNATGKISAFSSGLRELENLEKNPSPYDPPAEQTRKRHKRAKALQQKATQLENGIYSEIANRSQTLENSITQQAGLHPRDTDAEIRQVLRNMEHGDRITTLNEAIKNKDAVTLGAVANGNSLLTGISDETREKLLGVYKHQVAPDESKEYKALLEFIGEVSSVFSTVQKSVKEYQDAGTVEKANQQDAQAAEVENRVSQLFGEV